MTGGSHVDDRLGDWVNWAGDQQCHPARIVTPADEAEVLEAVQRAGREGLTVRAVGAGHSFNDIACTDGVLVDLSRMQRILDVQGTRITVEAGITLSALGPQNAARGLSLENQGDIDAQTLAGALATATHGTGRRFGNLSSRVVGMRLVTASGEIVDLSDTDTPHLLRAARVSLGALGIVTQVTVDCVPLFTLRRHDQPRHLDAVLDQLDMLASTNDHFEFFVFPYTRTALTRSSMRQPVGGTYETPPRRRIPESFVENTVLGAACRLARAAPRVVPRLNRAFIKMMGESTVQDLAFRVYAAERSIKFVETEYAIPRHHAAAALRDALALVERRRYPVPFPFEVRFTAPDDAYLSTAQGRETCYIAAHQSQGMEYEAFFGEFEQIMLQLDGRPHWGKRHTLGADTLRTVYPHWEDFQSVRADLDPTGLFRNPHVDRLLGPIARTV